MREPGGKLGLLLAVLLFGCPAILPARDTAPAATVEGVELLLEAEKYEEAETLARKLLRAAEAEHGAETLPDLGEVGAVECGAQRTDQGTARAGDDRVIDPALVGGHRLFVGERDAGHGYSLPIGG